MEKPEVHPTHVFAARRTVGAAVHYLGTCDRGRVNCGAFARGRVKTSPLWLAGALARALWGPLSLRKGD